MNEAFDNRKYLKAQQDAFEDVENFALLRRVFDIFGKDSELSHMQDAVDMGINQIIEGITDMESVVHACHGEMINRIQRYKKEVTGGIERVSTLDVAKEILGRFETLYHIQTNGRGKVE